MDMTMENLTPEQFSNLDKLLFFYEEQMSVHIKLNRKNELGKNIFLNGIIDSKLTDTLFSLKERVLGDIRVSLFEIRDDGVFEDRRGNWFMTIKSRKPFVAEDNSENNLIKDKEGKITGYKRSRYTVRIPFEVTKLWTPFNKDIILTLNEICKCEDKKYPEGLGRNMIFLAYIYPMFKDILDKTGFIAPNNISFCIEQAKRSEKEYEEIIKEIENGRRK